MLRGKHHSCKLNLKKYQTHNQVRYQTQLVKPCTASWYFLFETVIGRILGSTGELKRSPCKLTKSLRRISLEF